MRTERRARAFHYRNKPRHTQIAIIRRFCPKLCVISLPFETFRRLNALFTASCVPNVVHAFSSVETSPDSSKSQSFVDFVQIYTLFLSDRDISSFIRSFQCIMRADCSARDLQRRNKPRHTQIAIIRRVCPKFCVISLPCKIFRRLSAVFTVLCVQIVVHAIYNVETSPHTRKSQSFVDSDNNYALFLSC